MSKTKRIGIYVRVSTEEAARIQEGSLVSQRKRIEEYVEGQNRRESGWGVIVDTYCEEGRSAKDMNRPQFQRLLSDVKTGRVNLILATELSRLSRSIKDFCELWDLFKKHNTSFVTLREQIDTTTAAGELMVFNMMNMSQFERKQTAERISANWESRAKRGLWNGGSIPLGFDRNPKNKGELLVNDVEAKQVQTIFETFLKVGSVRKACFDLTLQGIFAKRYTNKYGDDKGGGHLTTSSLQHILTNRSYVGLRELSKRKGEGKAVQASWKPILNMDLFNQVQARLALNKNKYKPDEWKTYSYPLTELLICGECGKHLGGKSAHGRNGKHYYYSHPRKAHSDGVSHLKRCQVENVRALNMEEKILKSLKALANDPEQMNHWLKIYAQNTQTQLPGIEGRLKSIQTDIQTQSKRLENITSRLADLPSDLPADSIYEQIKGIGLKLKELENTKAHLNSQRCQITTQAIDGSQLQFRIKRTVANLESTPPELRRSVYSKLIQFAELYPTKIKLGLYAPAVKEGSEGLCFVPEGEGVRAGSSTVLYGARGGT